MLPESERKGTLGAPGRVRGSSANVGRKPDPGRKGEGMFREPRNGFTASLVVAGVLFAAMPAVAAKAPRGAGAEAPAWELLLARVLAWLESPADRGLAGLWGKYSSSIDPNGQPQPAAAPGGTATPDSSSSIDPNGQH